MLAATVSLSSAHAEQPHVHGLATLHVAVEGKTLHIELESPAANIVGFEHLPSTAEDKARVHNAASLLRNGSKLFSTPFSAQCTLKTAEVESTLLADDHDDHKENDHHDYKGVEKHDEHDDASEHHHEDKTQHSEFHVSYRFHCKRAEELTHLDVNLFKAFPVTETLNTQFATDSGQGAAKLHPGATRLTF